jgi:site-specific DNA recombinase
VKERMGQLEARQAEIEAALQHAEEPPPPLHPVMATLYREKVAQLSSALAHEDTKLEAAGILCGLVEKVVSPAEGGFALDLHGDLVGILALASNAKQPSGLSAGGLQVSLVVGPATGFVENR